MTRLPIEVQAAIVEAAGRILAVIASKELNASTAAGGASESAPKIIDALAAAITRHATLISTEPPSVPSDH